MGTKKTAPEEIVVLLGKHIKKHRETRKFTKEHVHKISGVPVRTIRHIERGEGGKLIDFIKIAQALDLGNLLKSFDPTRTHQIMQVIKASDKTKPN